MKQNIVQPYGKGYFDDTVLIRYNKLDRKKRCKQ